MSVIKPKEYELYEPVKRYFENEGYSVYGEVKGCDLIASKSDELIAVELKLGLSLTLVFQAMERRKITQLVYVGIPRPKSAKSKHFKNSIELLKTLGIGLIVVALDSPVKTVEPVLFPEGVKKPDYRKSRAVKQEIGGRSGDYNKGGVSRRIINTAYRERSIHIAVLLSKQGELSPKALVKQYGAGKDAGNILRGNFYGWFERVEKGIYRLSEKGKDALADERFAELVKFYIDYKHTEKDDNFD